MTEREKIQHLLADNVDVITNNMSEFLCRNVEDLLAAGVDRRDLTHAITEFALAYMIKLYGPAAAVREILTYLEAVEMCGCQQQRH